MATTLAFTPSRRKTGKHHQINVTADGMTPLAEFIGQGLMFSLQRMVLEILKPLMHQVEGFVNQLGSLIGSHGNDSEVEPLYAVNGDAAVTRATRVRPR